MTSYNSIVLLGAPGVGKGTQAVRLAKDLRVPKISTGDMLREAVANKTRLGLEAKAQMDAGALVSDEIVVGITRDRLAQADAEQGFILDGFPRTEAQAKALDSILQESGKDLRAILHMVVDDQAIVARLSGRRICRQCGAIYHVAYQAPQKEGVCDLCGGELYQRSDDNEAVVANRLNVYKKETAPLIQYYGARPGYREIDVSGPQNEVYESLLHAIKES